MRALWKGAITFGLVNIPVALYPATTRSDLSFRQLHAKDAAPIAYRRICTAENVEVPWPEIVKGYEYAKGEFVVMTEEDFKNADVDANQTIDIRDFVPADAIDFTYFEQPYYLEPTATGAKAYALLREALKRSGRVGIAGRSQAARQGRGPHAGAAGELAGARRARRARGRRQGAGAAPCGPAEGLVRRQS